MRRALLLFALRRSRFQRRHKPRLPSRMLPSRASPSAGRHGRGRADHVLVAPVGHGGADRRAVRHPADLLRGRDRSQQGRPRFVEARSDGGAVAAVRGGGRHARRRPRRAGQALPSVRLPAAPVRRRHVRRRRAGAAARDLLSHREPGQRRRNGAGARTVLLAAAHVDPADLDRARRHQRHSRSAGGGIHAASRIATRAPTCCRRSPACCSRSPA